MKVLYWVRAHDCDYVYIYVIVVDLTEARPQLRSEHRGTADILLARPPTTPTLHAVRALSWLARSPRSQQRNCRDFWEFLILFMFSSFSQRQYSPSLHMHTVSNNFIFLFILLSNFDINLYIYNNL